MSDGFWAVRAAESLGKRQVETQTYLRQEWPGESPGWFLRIGKADPARPAPGPIVSWILCLLRGPGPRGGRPSDA
jgi:hypothetical protein